MLECSKIVKKKKSSYYQQKHLGIEFTMFLPLTSFRQCLSTAVGVSLECMPALL